MWKSRRRERSSHLVTDEGLQQAREFVTSLDLPPAGSIRELVPFVETYTGRPVRLVPVTDRDALPGLGDSASPCGMWLALESADNIFFDALTSPAHQDLIIGHELAHILRESKELDGKDEVDTLAGLGDLGGLLPDMTPNMIRMLLAARGRTRYSVPAEADAEHIGSMLMEHVNSISRRGTARNDDPISRTLLRRPAR
ncbi:hypothetical protein ACIQ9R_36270 [Streptomyces sp. NPDC094447]|uniref:hypothetical protein n=1 Tax=Streptomyces sp. NPDC094447 TaxID=3366062 RepID=UPI0037FC37D9